MSLLVVGNVALALVAVVMSAIFSGLETGCYTINRIGLAVRVGRGERRARILDAELSRPDRVLATLLIGNNIAHYLSGLGIAAILEVAGFGPLASVAINLAVLLPITFVAAETLPKDLFRTYTDVWTYHFAVYLRGWRLLLTAVPLVPTVAFIADRVKRWIGGNEQAALVEPRQRIAKLIQEGVHAGVLSEEQTTLADRALRLRGLTVSGEMTPWPRVTTLLIDAPLGLRAATLAKSGASRLPVVDRTGKVVGVLTALDAILDPTASTAVLMKPATVFTPTEPAMAALRVMRSVRARLAVVIDPGTTQPLGVVAIKDLIEPVTGNLVGS